MTIDVFSHSKSHWCLITETSPEKGDFTSSLLQMVVQHHIAHRSVCSTTEALLLIHIFFSVSFISSTPGYHYKPTLCFPACRTLMHHDWRCSSPNHAVWVKLLWSKPATPGPVMEADFALSGAPPRRAVAVSDVIVRLWRSCRRADGTAAATVCIPIVRRPVTRKARA